MGKLDAATRQLNKKLLDLVRTDSGTNKTPVISQNFAKFNEMIGLPQKPGTSIPTPILDYQIKYFDAINKHHKVILNKSRKIGATETALRCIAYHCFGRYAGHNVMIVAGTRQVQANEFLGRFYELLSGGFTDMAGVHFLASDIIKSKTNSEIKFRNGTCVKAYPANPGSLRGPEDVICVYISEAAHINLSDDSKVYNALHPINANSGDADFIMDSTPNGKRGFFWKIFTSDNE